jgi:asparagine synthase (glutamine-hydrolysing)
MCGIAGIVSCNPNIVQQQTLQAMGNALQHRGPDGEGFYINPTQTIGLAHRRLAIIDLSKEAAQPMHFPASNNGLKARYCITYNGEIYNYLELRETLQQKGYHFHTQSDTEVLLAMYDCYKEGCLTYLDGMFAFAIWDETAQQLFAARDRFGEKPFYFHFDELRPEHWAEINGYNFFFASEMKALWAAGLPKAINNTALLNYVGAGLVSTPNHPSATFYKGVYQLAAGHYLQLQLKQDELWLDVQPYWPTLIQTQSINEQQAAERLQQLLHQSVARRLRCDVPLGTSLSGGLDSSSIASLVQQQSTSHQLQTFSAVFPGFDRDESKNIAELTSLLQLQNHTVTPTAEGLADELQRLMYYQEEPVQSSSAYAQYKVYELAKQCGVTVLLDGQGADEILAGYANQMHWYGQELISKGKWLAAQHQMKQANANNWGIKHYVAAFFPAQAAKALEQKLQQQILSNAFVNTDFAKAYFDESTTQKPIISSLNEVLQYHTTQVGLPELLRYADRNSMAHGREVRLPFLSHELVEFVFSLPSAFKINNGYGKWILRKAMNHHLPKNIVWNKTKIGFEPPQQQWMQHTAMQELVQAAKAKLVQEGILNKTALKKNIQQKPAHAGENFDWWWLCTFSLIT